MGLVAPRHVGSYWNRDQTCVPYTGRQIINHCTTRGVPEIKFFFFFKGTILRYVSTWFFFFKFYLFMAVLGLRFCARAFSSCGKRGATLHRGARASHHRGLSCCGAQAPDAQAQQLWLTGPVAPRHVGSSQTRAQTRVPCISRQILNHCTTREALKYF